MARSLRDYRRNGEMRAGRGGGAASLESTRATGEFLAQPFKCLGIVHIVPFGKANGFKSDFLRALERQPRDRVASPGDILKQMPMRKLESDQIIAAIGGGPQNHPVAGPPKRLDGVAQQTRRQRRAIAIDQGDTVM